MLRLFPFSVRCVHTLPEFPVNCEKKRKRGRLGAAFGSPPPRVGVTNAETDGGEQPPSPLSFFISLPQCSSLGKGGGDLASFFGVGVGKLKIPPLVIRYFVPDMSSSERGGGRRIIPIL